MVDSFNYAFENGDMSISEKRGVISLIIHMKKLFDSDWPRAVQFKCNTGANYTS